MASLILDAKVKDECTVVNALIEGRSTANIPKINLIIASLAE